MKKKLYQDELEGFLSESAEDLRMYPSARVWRNIDTKIHGEKKWPALTFAAFLTGAISLAGLIFMQPDKDLFKPKAIATSVSKVAIAKNLPFKNFVISQNPFDAATPMAGAEFVNETAKQEHMLVPKSGSENTVMPEDAEVLTNASDVELAENLSGNNVQSGITTSNEIMQDDWIQYRLQHGISATNQYRANLNTNPAEPMQHDVSAAYANRFSAGVKPMPDDAGGAPTIMAAKSLKPSKWRIQYYATPSFSYRLLSEDMKASGLAASTGTAQGLNSNSVANLVSDKPKLGIEAGVAFMYNVTDFFRVKAGLQINYRQFAIDAYASRTVQPALIRVSQGNSSYDTIFAASRVSNVGLQQDAMEITNHFFQIGVPVGFELDMMNFKRSQFVLAATFQPTYNIGQQAWLISSDYRSFVKQPDLMRKWNFNTGVEAFVRFSNKSGNLNWQVGPQIRYQLLPGAVNKYPVREHLIDYGLKIGVSKTLK